MGGNYTMRSNDLIFTTYSMRKINPITKEVIIDFRCDQPRFGKTHPDKLKD